MGDLEEKACVTRVIGSCALSLAYVASGRAAGLVLGGANPIDVAAGVLLARESGAVVKVGPAVDRVLGPEELGSGPRYWLRPPVCSPHYWKPSVGQQGATTSEEVRTKLPG